MDLQNEKCVMVIDEALPLGLIANTAAILGITLGKEIPDTVGPDVTDKTGCSHRGIIQIPVPILKASSTKIRELRQMLYQPEYVELITADFSDVAQCINVYDEFIRKAADTEEESFTYLGIAIYGPKKVVNKLTGYLPLLR